MSSLTFNSTSARYKNFLRTNDDSPLPHDIARRDLGGHIPGHHNIMTPANDGPSDPKLRCCCGRADCAYLEHNNAAVDDIEKKLERAAQLGQVRALSPVLSCRRSTLARSHSPSECLRHTMFNVNQTCHTLDLFTCRLTCSSSCPRQCPSYRCNMHAPRKPSQEDSSSGLTFALQALLTRHESYVAESQQEHTRLDAKIAQLEVDRTALQNANERMVAENKELLSKLETLNDSYKASDNTVKTLEALLHDTEMEVRRLNRLARRAEDLGIRVQEMDKQRAELMQRLADGETESRSTLTRWRESERKVKQLELEVQKIEWEARMDREKARRGRGKTGA